MIYEPASWSEGGQILPSVPFCPPRYPIRAPHTGTLLVFARRRAMVDTAWSNMVDGTPWLSMVDGTAWLMWGSDFMIARWRWLCNRWRGGGAGRREATQGVINYSMRDPVARAQFFTIFGSFFNRFNFFFQPQWAVGHKDILKVSWNDSHCRW